MRATPSTTIAALLTLAAVFTIACNSARHLNKGMIGGSGYDAATAIVATEDGGFVLTGNMSSNDGDFRWMQRGKADAFLLRLDSSGRIVWKETYGGYGEDGARSIVPLQAGGYLLGGFAKPANGLPGGVYKGNYDASLIRINPEGKFVGSVLVGGSDTESGNSVTACADGGSILVGATATKDGDFAGHGLDSSNTFLARFDRGGFLKWSKLYGGNGSDGAWRSCATPDNGLVIVGSTASSDGLFPINKGERDVFVFKVDSTGDVLWSRIYGGTKTDVAKDITLLRDGGFAVTGWTHSRNGDLGLAHSDSSDVFVLRLNSDGKMLWSKTIGGLDADNGHSIMQTPDDGFIVVGHTKSQDGDFLAKSIGKFDIFVLKLDLQGNILWVKTYGGTDNDFASSVINTRDGGIALCGTSNSNSGTFRGMNHGDYDIVILKLDADGALLQLR